MFYFHSGFSVSPQILVLFISISTLHLFYTYLYISCPVVVFFYVHASFSLVLLLFSTLFVVIGLQFCCFKRQLALC